MEETITELRDYLTNLKKARNDLVSGGAIKSIKKGDFFTTFHSLEELSIEIRHIQEKISVLEVNI